MMPALAPDIVWLLVAAPFVGSFLSLLVVRLPAHEPVVLARSRCRHCARPLGLPDLVPLLSWLATAGRCRHCGKPIGTLYPLMEIAAVLVVIWAASVASPETVWLSTLLGWTLLTLAVIDARSFRLPDVLTLPLMPAGLAASLWLAPDDFWLHAVGLVAGAAVLEIVALAYRRVRHREGLGLGDVKLLAGAGAWVALTGLGSVLLWAVLVNLTLLGLGMVKGDRVTAATRIPLGTGIAAGLWLTWLYGPLSIV